MDGNAENDVTSPDIAERIIRAVDGVKLNSLHIQKAFKAGVTTSVSQPFIESKLLAGVSVAFRTGVKNTCKLIHIVVFYSKCHYMICLLTVSVPFQQVLDSNDTFVKEEAALHFAITHSGVYISLRSKEQRYHYTCM